MSAYDQRVTLVIVALGIAVAWVLAQPRGELPEPAPYRPLPLPKPVAPLRPLTPLPKPVPLRPLTPSPPRIHTEWDDEFELTKKIERLLPDSPVTLPETWDLGKKAELRDYVDGLIDVYHGRKDSDLLPQDLTRKRELESLLVDLKKVIAAHKKRISSYGGTGTDWEEYAETEGGYLVDEPEPPRGGWTNRFTDARLAALPAAQYFPQVELEGPGDSDADLEELDAPFTYLRDGDALPYVDADA